MEDAIFWDTYRSFGGTPTARSAQRVAEALVALAQPRAKSPEARNLERLEAACARLRAALDRRAEGTAGLDGRPVDLRADRAWGALELRLRAWSSLSEALGAEHEKVRRARELLVAIFADGTEFLKLPYAEQEVEMDRLLRSIDREGLERDLIALAGREFVEAVRAAQGDYAEMVTTMLARDEQKERVAAVLRELVRAVERYASSVLGALDDEDPKSVERTRRLLAPLANHRAALAAREGAREKEPDAPKPAPAA